MPTPTPMPDSNPPDRRVENERNTELLHAELPAARYVDGAYLRWLYDENPYGPAIQRSGRRRRRARRALRDDPAAVPRAATASCPPPSRCTRSCAAVRNARASSRSSGSRSTTEAAETGWTVRDRGLQRQVDRRGREVHGLEDARAAAGAAVRAAPTPDAASTSHAVDAAFLAGPEFDRADRRARRLPGGAAGRTRTPPSTCAGGWRARARRTSVHADDDLVADHHPDERFGDPRRGGPQAPARAPAVRRRSRAGRDDRRRVPLPPRAVRGVRGLQPPRAASVASSRPRRLQPSPLHLILRSLVARRRPATRFAARHVRVPRHGRVLSR